MTNEPPENKVSFLPSETSHEKAEMFPITDSELQRYFLGDQVKSLRLKPTDEGYEVWATISIVKEPALLYTTKNKVKLWVSIDRFLDHARVHYGDLKQIDLIFDQPKRRKEKEHGSEHSGPPGGGTGESD